MYKPYLLLKTFSIALVSALMFNSTVMAESAPPIKTAYSASKIAPSVYVIHGPAEEPNPVNQGFMNNPGIIIGDDGIIVVDAGSTFQVGQMVLSMIKTISDKPVVATFSTHIHGDHWLGNQAISEAYPEVKHYAHANMIEQAIGGEGQNWVDIMATLTEGASLGTEFIAPTNAVKEGETITISGRSFSIYHDEIAHTNTDIAILLNDEKVLFMGDTAMNGSLRRIDDGTFKGLIAFLERMSGMGAQVYVPGHGNTGDRTVIERFQWMLETVFETVKEEYENGLSDFEMKPIIEEKLKANGPWADLDTALGKFVSLAYLEVESDSF